VETEPAIDSLERGTGERSILLWGSCLLALHIFAMFYSYGSLPVAPVFGDEIIINDPAIALSRGQGLRASSFTDSVFGIDKLYAHFPPIYIYVQSLIFRLFGVSVYSLRLTTTLMSIAAAAVFILLLQSLCKWRVVERRTALLLAALYTLNASTIVLHRVGRMESTIEFFCLCSLFCVLTVIFGPVEGNLKKIGLLLVGSLMAGFSLATHPESISAILPIALLLLIAVPVRMTVRAASLATLWLTPIAIWLLTYRSRWSDALQQMSTIAKAGNTPPPSVFRFGLGLLHTARSNQHNAMFFTLFYLSFIAMLMVLVRSSSAIWLHVKQPANLRSHSSASIATHTAFTLAIPLTLVLLLWFLPASVMRYEVMYPVYLIGLALPPPQTAARNALYSTLRVLVAFVICLNLVASIVYLNQNRPSVDFSPDRYDAVVGCIPPGAHAAATPHLWLAFQKKNLPFTLLYPDFDGLSNWRAEAMTPLDQFDVILMDDSLEEVLTTYRPYSEKGRLNTEIMIGSQVLHVYSRVGQFSLNCGAL
jgi:4-amino-4-deoxy-L-arabinose transferase-like glycosyltransferase